MRTLESIAVKPQAKSKGGLRVPYSDNPLLGNPRIRFMEEMSVAYEREFGKEGEHLQNAKGMLDCFRQWCKCNGFSWDEAPKISAT